MMVGLQYTHDLNPCSARVTNTLRNGNLSFCSFSIVNCDQEMFEHIDEARK